MTVTGLTTGGAGSESAAVLDHVHVTVKDDGGNIVVDQDLALQLFKERKGNE